MAYSTCLRVHIVQDVPLSFLPVCTRTKQSLYVRVSSRQDIAHGAPSAREKKQIFFFIFFFSQTRVEGALALLLYLRYPHSPFILHGHVNIYKYITYIKYTVHKKIYKYMYIYTSLVSRSIV